MSKIKDVERSIKIIAVQQMLMETIIVEATRAMKKGIVILTSNRGFAELVDSVVATALLDRLLHHTVVVQLEDANCRLHGHSDFIPERAGIITPITLAPASKRHGRPLKNRGACH